MRIGLRVHASSGFRDLASVVPDLEKAGLDIVWVAEAYGFDAPTLTGYLAAKTEHLQIGSGILSVFSRPATLLAQTAAALDHVSRGRAILGLGASNPQVVEGWFGVPFREPVRTTREVIDVCRAVWRREVVEARGVVEIPLDNRRGTGLGKALKIIPHLERDAIPIYVAASGPRNVEMVAEVADGWMPLLFIPEAADRVWGQAIRSGTARRSAARGPLEVVAGGILSVADRPSDAALAMARDALALYLGGMGATSRNFYANLARRYGFGADVDRIQALFMSGDRAGAARAVPEVLVEETNLIGSAARVAERIAAMREAGVTVLDVRLAPGNAAPDQIAQLRDLVGS